MVEWTEEERAFIQEIFSKLKYEDVGPKSLCRYVGNELMVLMHPLMLAPEPETVVSCASLQGSGRVPLDSALLLRISGTCTARMPSWETRRWPGTGAVVLHGLDAAVKNMDNIKSSYAELSELHCEKLHVDPDNFKLMADCITVVDRYSDARLLHPRHAGRLVQVPLSGGLSSEQTIPLNLSYTHTQRLCYTVKN
ncbi:hypothetical protein AOLI_G00129930 [Acnodon oligacanthus]